jgi:predicted DNA-binding transcriptional regulator AlpA
MTENKNPEIQFAISIKTLAKMLSVSKRQIHRLRACGKIGPEEIRLGGSIRYRLPEVHDWINSTPSCADRQTWKAMKGGAS